MDITVSRIEMLVEETGATVRELADAAGCSKSAMQRYVSGGRAIPTNIITGLASIFRVSPAYLLGWTDDRAYDPKAEKPVTSVDDGLSDEQRKLIDLVKQCPDDQAAALLQAMQLFLQNWSK